MISTLKGCQPYQQRTTVLASLQDAITIATSYPVVSHRASRALRSRSLAALNHGLMTGNALRCALC